MLVCNIKWHKELFCAAKNNWSWLTPEASHIHGTKATPTIGPTILNKQQFQNS